MEDDRQRYIPVRSDGSSGEPESKVSFMIRGLLSSRLEIGLPSDANGVEEDVNIYLTHLLCSYVDPEHYLRIAKYLSTYDSQVFERVQSSTSTRLKYTVYKTNADHLLISIGVFQNAMGRRSDVLSPLLQPDEDLHVGRAKTYYDFACTYSHSVFGRTSAISDVLGKLAVGFEKYVKILSHMRVDYLNFIERMTDGELYHLQRSAERAGLEALRNELLDTYSEYRQDPTPERRSRLAEIAEHLRKLDPNFKFEMPEA